MGINLVGTPSYATTSAAGYIVGSCTYTLLIENNNGGAGNYAAADALFLVAYNNGAGTNNDIYSAIGFSTNGTDGQHHRGFIKATRDIINSGAANAGRLTLGVRKTDGNYGEVLHLTSGENVGIGTCTPTAKFHNTGTSQFGDTLGFGSNGRISWGGETPRFIVTSCGGYNMVLGTDNFVDRMTIQCGTGRVGIGTSNPCTTLHITNGCGAYSVPDTTSTPNIYVFNSNSTCTTAHSMLTLRTNSAGGGNPFISFDINDVTGWSLGIDNADTDKFKLGWGWNSVSANTALTVITSTLHVGIGTSSPSYKLHVNGTFYAAGSSQDYKQSICNYNTDSCMFMKLKPVTYQYKEEYCHLGKELKSGTQIGLIAEEVAETYPELAILVNEEANKVVRNVDYEKLSVILLSEVQKLRREVDDLKHKQ